MGKLSPEELWRAEFTGQSPTLQRLRRLWKLLPGAPRCKQCNAPFGGLGAPIASLRGRQRSKKNPRYCNYCDTIAREHRGGAEIELTLLFADVRGSTALAERISPTAFSQLMSRFYAVASHVLIHTDAWIDKFVGDEVIGLYFPFLPDHSARAVHAALDLMRATGQGSASGPWVPIGIGIHTGTAFVGAIGGDETAPEVTALGDAVNLTARLVAAAAAGEILISDAAFAAAGLADEDLERRELTLKGKSEPVAVRVMRAAAA
jgi:adenylate cyclase